MPRSFADARRWMEHGTTLLSMEAELGDDALSVPPTCPATSWPRCATT